MKNSQKTASAKENMLFFRTQAAPVPTIVPRRKQQLIKFNHLSEMRHKVSDDGLEGENFYDLGKETVKPSVFAQQDQRKPRTMYNSPFSSQRSSIITFATDKTNAVNVKK